jgi:hypothetical protein
LPFRMSEYNSTRIDQKKVMVVDENVATLILIILS